jgi:hypothetical protein
MGMTSVNIIEALNSCKVRIKNVRERDLLTSHSLEIGLRVPSAVISMARSHPYLAARNNTSGINAFPANSLDPTGEWGRADPDARHRLDLLGAMKVGRFSIWDGNSSGIHLPLI